MTLSLPALAACFEGIVPSILCTLDADGMPNISYLSHVAQVGDAQIALSNQFFTKTAANLRSNPRAALLVVDPASGAQYRLDILHRESLDHGPAFARVAADLRATSTQLGMAEVMRLRAIEVFEVLDIRAIPHDAMEPLEVRSRGEGLARAETVSAALARASGLGGVVDGALDALCAAFGQEASMVLLHDPARACLVALGSRGYGASGIGAEVPMGEGLIGLAAQERRPFRVGDLSRLRRYGAAIESGANDEARTRSVRLPHLPNALSQAAIPMELRGTLRGVLFLESSRRRAFDGEDERALIIAARHLAMAVALAEAEEDGISAGVRSEKPAPAPGRAIRIVHHAQDDSVFIDHAYLVKGVPGRLLMWMLDAHLSNMRTDFTNREIRADTALRLPDIKDNLETRLLLLQRRLEEKRAPIRLLRPGRGQLRLEVAGRLEVTSDRALG